MASPIESLVQKYAPQTALDYENALKEVIQEITLAGLARGNFFDKAAFYGGTALRIFHGLPRFSEDLDFTLLRPQPEFKLEPYFKHVLQSLEAFGFETQIEAVEKDEDRKVESAFLNANTQIHFLKISAAQMMAQKIQANKIMSVKFEVDVTAPLNFETEIKVLPPPITASVKTLTTSSLFAGKMHAVLFRKWKKRVKGRDFYDLLWYLGQGVPVKLSYLETKMKDTGFLKAQQKLTKELLVHLLEDRIQSIDWKNAKKDVVNFLRDPHEVEGWSQDLFLAAIRSLKVS